MIYNTQLAVLVIAVAAISFLRNDWYSFVLIPVLAAAFFTEKAACLITRSAPQGTTSHSLVLALSVFLLLPVKIFWPYMVGLAVFAIMVKHLQGGLGRYWLNPALAIIFLFELTHKKVLLEVCPALSGVDSALTMNKEVLNGIVPANNDYWFIDSFVNKFVNVASLITGKVDGPMAMVPVVFALVGLYFIYRGYLNWRVPLVYLLSVVIALVLLPILTEQGTYSFFRHFPGVEEVLAFMIYHVFSGFMVFSATVLFTDYSCRPLTVSGQVLAAFAAGTLTVAFRYYLPFLYPAADAVLFTGALTPLFDIITRRKPKTD